MCRLREAFTPLVIGGGSMAIVQLADLRDIVTIALGVVSSICMIYSTFFRNRSKICRHADTCPHRELPAIK